MCMVAAYIQAAMREAVYEPLADRTFFGNIPGFQGVWANAATLEACRDELAEVLEGWALLRIADHLDLPVVAGRTIVVKASAS